MAANQNITSMKSKISILLPLFFFGLFTLHAQNPVPGTTQSQKMAIVGATLHLGNGEVIENGQVLFANGKIEQVGPTTQEAQVATKRLMPVESTYIPALLLC